MATHAHVTHAKPKHRNGVAHPTSHLDGVIDGAEALVAATAEMSGDKIVDLRDRLKADLEAARHQAGKLETQVRERTNAVDDYVHENPWQAIGVAAAAGVLVGALVFRK